MKLLTKTEFWYNNIKNAITIYIIFKIKFGYYYWVLFKNKINIHLKFSWVNKLAKKLRKIIIILYQNIFYFQKFQKKVFKKYVKSKTYTHSKKTYFNIKKFQKQLNYKSKNKIFTIFYILYLLNKQNYKLKLLNK